MIHPEYKVVNDSIYLPEGGKGLQSKTRLKFVQNEKAVALYDGSAYVGQFISSSGEKVHLDENKNIIIPSNGEGEGIDLSKLNGSDSIEIEKNEEERTAIFTVKDSYLKEFIGSNVSIVAKPEGGVIVEKLDNGKASAYELCITTGNFLEGRQP